MNGEQLIVRFSLVDNNLPAVFKINAPETIWGSISGDIQNQTDLINALSGKQDTISDLSTIRENASEGANAYGTIQTYGDIVTHDVSEFATSAQGSLADTALQPNDNISELTNNAGFITGIAWGDITGTLSDQTDLQNALNNADEIFDVTYNTTTYAEISTALANGKLPVCNYGNRTYIYCLTAGDIYYFTAAYAPYIYILRCYPTSLWNATDYVLEQTSNKVTTISSASTDTQYPSAKCVYDICGDIETLINAL